MFATLVNLLAYVVAVFYTGMLCVLLGIAIITDKMQWAWSFIPRWWAAGGSFCFSSQSFF